MVTGRFRLYSRCLAAGRVYTPCVSQPPRRVPIHFPVQPIPRRCRPPACLPFVPQAPSLSRLSLPNLLSHSTLALSCPALLCYLSPGGLNTALPHTAVGVETKQTDTYRGRSLLTKSGPLANPDSNSNSGGGERGGMMGAPQPLGGGWRVDIVGPQPSSSPSKDQKKALPSASSASESPAGSAIVWLNDIEVCREWGVGQREAWGGGACWVRQRGESCLVVVVVL